MGISNTIPPSRLIQPGVVANTAARPTSPFTGQAIYQVDTNQMLIWNGTAWVIPNTPAQNPTGLELVKTQTIGSAVSSVDITDAFSATYDNYVVTVTAVDSSAAGPTARLTFGGVAGSAYYGSMYYDRFNAADTGTLRASAAAFVPSAIYGDSDEGTQTMTLYNPFASKRTAFTSQYYGGGYSGWASGMLYTTASYTYFTLTMSTGTMTGGTVTVFGYRK